MTHEFQLPPMAKPPRRRVAPDELDEKRDSAKLAGTFYDDKGSVDSDAAALGRLLQPNAAPDSPAIIDSHGGADSGDSQADLLQIPVAGAAPMPKHSPASPAAPPPLTAMSMVHKDLRRVTQWLRSHPLILLAIPVTLIALGVACWLVFPSEMPVDEAGARRPPRRRDPAIRYENMSSDQVRQLGQAEQVELQSLVEEAATAANWTRVINLSRKLLEAKLGEAGLLWLRQAQAQFALGQEQESIVTGYQARTAGVKDLALTMRLAQWELAHDRSMAALPLLTEAVAMAPTEKPAKLMLGQALLEHGQPEEARAIWSQLAEVDFPDDLLRRHLQLLRQHGDPVDAYRCQLFVARKFHELDDYLVAADLAPDQDQRLYVLAEAAGLFRENPDRDRLLLLRSDALITAGKKREANLLLKGIRIQDQPPDALPHLAEMISRAGGTSEELKYLWEEMRRIYPRDLAIHRRIAEIMGQVNGGRQQLRALYGRWVREEPEAALPQYIFGLSLDNDDLALACFDRALQLQANFPEAALAAAELCRRRADLPKAKRYYQEALQLRPNDRATNFGLAMNNLTQDGEAALRRHAHFLTRIEVPAAEALPELLLLAQRLPFPEPAEAILAKMAQVPELAAAHRLQRIRIGLIYQRLADEDFDQADSREMREYQLLYLLGQGRIQEALMLPTPKEDFPDFWKVFLCWRQKLKIWHDNADLLLAKHPDELLIESAIGLWQRTLSFADATARLSRLPPEQKPLLALMIAERHRQDGNRTRARIEYLRALRLAGVGPYTQVVRWLSEH